MNKNDEKIVELKKYIKEKRENIGKFRQYSPVTNCILQMDGETYNLHVACDELLLVKLNALAMSAHDLGLSTDNLVISGFSLTDWLRDVDGFIAEKRMREDIAKLDSLEKRLNTLMSSDMKIGLEIEAILSDLNGK